MEDHNVTDNYDPTKTTSEKINSPVSENTTEVPVAESSTPEAPAEPQAQEAKYALFGAIGYNNPTDIPAFIDRMQPRDAIFLVISAAKFGYEKQIYSLLESEVLSKAIRVLTLPPDTTIPVEQEKTT